MCGCLKLGFKGPPNRTLEPANAIPADVMRSNAVSLFVRVAKVFGGLPRSS